MDYKAKMYQLLASKGFIGEDATEAKIDEMVSTITPAMNIEGDKYEKAFKIADTYFSDDVPSVPSPTEEIRVSSPTSAEKAPIIGEDDFKALKSLLDAQAPKRTNYSENTSISKFVFDKVPVCDALSDQDKKQEFVPSSIDQAILERYKADVADIGDEENSKNFNKVYDAIRDGNKLPAFFNEKALPSIKGVVLNAASEENSATKETEMLKVSQLVKVMLEKSDGTILGDTESDPGAILSTHQKKNSSGVVENATCVKFTNKKEVFDIVKKSGYKDTTKAVFVNDVSSEQPTKEGNLRSAISFQVYKRDTAGAICYQKDGKTKVRRTIRVTGKGLVPNYVINDAYSLFQTKNNIRTKGDKQYISEDMQSKFQQILAKGLSATKEGSDLINAKDNNVQNSLGEF